jgi:hypothetical protein
VWVWGGAAVDTVNGLPMVRTEKEEGQQRMCGSHTRLDVNESRSGGQRSAAHCAGAGSRRIGT